MPKLNNNKIGAGIAALDRALAKNLTVLECNLRDEGLDLYLHWGEFDRVVTNLDRNRALTLYWDRVAWLVHLSKHEAVRAAADAMTGLCLRRLVFRWFLPHPL